MSPNDDAVNDATDTTDDAASSGDEAVMVDDASADADTDDSEPVVEPDPDAVTITINGTEDAPVIGGTSTGTGRRHMVKHRGETVRQDSQIQARRTVCQTDMVPRLADLNGKRHLINCTVKQVNRCRCPPENHLFLTVYDDARLTIITTLP